MLQSSFGYYPALPKGYDYMGETDVRMNNLWGFYSTLPERYPDIEEELDKEIWEHFSGMGHKIGGYAFFTQADVRSWTPQVKDYILLLQIDTDEDIMWGDAGVGNFFIHPDDLAKKDFSKVLYNWDCA